MAHCITKKYRPALSSTSVETFKSLSKFERIGQLGQRRSRLEASRPGPLLSFIFFFHHHPLFATLSSLSSLLLVKEQHRFCGQAAGGGSRGDLAGGEACCHAHSNTLSYFVLAHVLHLLMHISVMFHISSCLFNVSLSLLYLHDFHILQMCVKYSIQGRINSIILNSCSEEKIELRSELYLQFFWTQT